VWLYFADMKNIYFVQRDMKYIFIFLKEDMKYILFCILFTINIIGRFSIKKNMICILLILGRDFYFTRNIVFRGEMICILLLLCKYYI